MRLALILAGGMAIGAALHAAPAVASGTTPRSAETTRPTDVSAVKRKRQRAVRATPRTGSQIACTRFGCRPIPPGCRIETEYNPFSWNPSGYDAVVCPGR